MDIEVPRDELDTAPRSVPPGEQVQSSTPVPPQDLPAAASPASAIPADRISELYRGEIFTEETARAARDRIHWMCAQCVGNTVLDVGCSQGIVSILLAREGLVVTAIDPHPDSIAFARAEIGRESELVRARITLLETDLASLPPQARFDTILLGEVIEHQALPVRLLREAKSRLGTGGRIVVTTPFGLHPHPDHKVSLFPRDLIEFAAQIDMHIASMETDGAYMRCVMLSEPGAGAPPSIDALLRTTEVAALRHAERLFARLDERAQELDKRASALRITQRKLTEATNLLESRTKEQAAEVKSLRLKHEGALEALRAEHLRSVSSAKAEARAQVDAALGVLREQHAGELSALQACLDTAAAEAKSVRRDAEAMAQQHLEELGSVKAQASDATALAQQRQEQVEALQAQAADATALARRRQEEFEALQAQLSTAVVARSHEVDALQAQLRELRASHKHEVGQLNTRNERLKDRISALNENMRATKETSSYRLGRLLVHGCKSPRAFLRLPAGLWALGSDIRERRKTRRLLAEADADHPTPQLAESRTTPSDAPVAHASDGRTALRAAAQAQVATAQAAPRVEASVEALSEIYAEGGLAALKRRLLEVRPLIGGRTTASRVLQLGKLLAETKGSAVSFSLAKLALEFDRSEATLRGYFWSAQRARQFEAASDAIAALARCYGDNPTEQQKAVLDKLRISPAHQLSALKLVPERATNPVAGIRGRICYVLHNSLPYSSGGYATRSQGVATGMRQAGRDVIVLTRPGFPLDITIDPIEMVVPPQDHIDGITYVRTLDPKRRGLSMVRYVTAAADAIEQQLRSLRPEIVMAASNHVTALPALVAARRAGLPFIYEIRGLWEITRSSREEEFLDTAAFAVQSLLEARVAQLADRVFTLTEPMREELVQRGVPAEKIQLLPNSCDPERFLPRPRDTALAERLGIPPGVPVIGYIGTFVDYEGLEDLALACALLKKRGVDFRLMLVGNENASGTDRGPITEQIARIAASEEIGDCLIMTGRVPHSEVEAYYSLIDIAPFPRKPWPVCEMVSPMKPLEALAMEKAVLVSSVRALTEMITDGKTGSVFEKGNVASLAEKLGALITDPALRAELGRAGRKWVSTERTWQRIGLTLEDTFAQMLRDPATAQQDTRTVPDVVDVSSKPVWWNRIDETFRARCAFVDVTSWAPSAEALDLRASYVSRFGEEAVARRMPASNWARADICAQMVAPSANLLDIGSGLGEFVNLVARQQRHGTITSVDRKDYDLWMDDTGRIERIYKDLYELDAGCARDTVTCFEVIEHLPPERVAEAVAVLHSLARRVLYVSVPFMEPLPLYKGHFTRFDHRNLSELFPEARFTIFGRGGGDEVRAWILCEVEAAALGAARDGAP